MATPEHKVERALRFVSHRLNATTNSTALVNGEKVSRGTAYQATTPTTVTQSTATRQLPRQHRFVDLGSGDGTAVFTAASLDYQSTGFELNPTLWLISSLRRLTQPSTIRRQCKIVMGDMFQSPVVRSELKKADCVMIFGVNSLMSQIAALVQTECRSGSFIMSYRFRVPLFEEELRKAKKKADDEDDAKLRISGINASLVYEKEEMRVYELLKERGTKGA